MFSAPVRLYPPKLRSIFAEQTENILEGIRGAVGDAEFERLLIGEGEQFSLFRYTFNHDLVVDHSLGDIRAAAVRLRRRLASGRENS